MAEAAAAKLAEEAVVGIVNQVKHHFRYLSQYHENMRNLEATVKNLEKKEVSVRDEVFRAESSSQTIKDGVNAWLGKVKDIKEDAESILEMKTIVGSGCWKGWCVNICPRYRISKKAIKKTADLVTFIEEGVFDAVAHPKRHLGFVTSHIEQTTDENNIRGNEISNNSNATKEEVITSKIIAAGVDERLESRTILLNDVMGAVRDPEIRMVRICGMGGIGKTTMAKQVEQMARKERLFHEIAMVEINKNPDLKLLQLHIAELLGLQITEDDVRARARRLGERLQGQSSVGPNKKILLILDNVWKIEDLENAGIPLKDANGCCKIILTSRYDDICKGLMHEKEFRVEFLSDQEALTLFNQSLSNIGGYYDETISRDLVKECGGLPIAVAAIAGAVNNKMEREWKNVLRKLQSSGIRKDYDAVIKCLEISYDFLENEYLKKFFRLCCLFSKGSDVSIEELTRYGIALRLFNVREYLCDAREESFSYVQKLLHSNLFLCSDRADCFKVHDIVWDFAVSAPSSDLFLVNHDSTLKKFPREDSYEDFTSISLQCNELFQAPESFSFSKLKLLRLTGDKETCYVESIGNFFKETNGLYVLDISSMTLSSTLMPFEQLSRLRMLSLAKCTYLGGDVSSIGKLNYLEILNFAYSDIKELPIDIKSLKSLRLLDLTMCQKCVIVPGVLPELTSLEELYMRKVPLCDAKGSESVFVDIASMSTLVVLHIKIPEDRVQLMNSLFKKLKKFKIFVNTHEKVPLDEDQYENSLHIRCDSSILLQPGLTSLLQKATRMELHITQLMTLQPLNDSETLDFSELKTLKLESCADLVCLLNTMDVLQRNFVSPFRHLKVLEISQCHKLEHVLTVSAAKGLCVLETLRVQLNSSVKVIFWKEREDESNIVLPGLKKLHLRNLDNLICCYNVIGAVDFPQLQKVSLEHLPLITSLIECETEMLASGDKDASCNNPLFRHKEPDTGCRFPNLTSLKVKWCVRLRHICMPSMANSIGEVQELEIFGCTEFEAIVKGKNRKEGDEKDGETQVLLLQKLNYLQLAYLDNLSSIVPPGYTLKWSSLKTLDVSDSGDNMIQTGTTIDRQTLLTNLRGITIDGVRSLKLLSRLIPGGFSSEIRDINIPGHDQLSSVFSPSLIRGYDHLENISIANLDSQVVFNLEDECSVGFEAETAALNKLDLLYIGMLCNVTHVWWKVPRNFEGFHNLTYLTISGCDSLRYLFSPSIAKCLVKLQRVEIWSCDMIEEIVSTADEGEKEVQKRSDDIVFFPQLQNLRLSNLPCVTCINLGVCGSGKLFMEAPNAESIQMLHHDVSSSSSSSTSTLICTQKRSNSAPFTSMRKGGIRRSWSFLHLTQMYLFGCYNMSTLFPPNIQVRLPVLKFLYILRSQKLRYIFSSNQSLRSLRILEISDCKMLEVIVKNDEEEGSRSNFIFPTLRYVHLESLPNLKGFCLGQCTFDWPSLIELKIDDCINMKIFTLGYSTMPLLDHLVRDSTQHNLAEEGGNINTTLTTAVEKDLDNLYNSLKEQYILTRTGFMLAADHLEAECSSWCWFTRYHKCLIRKDVPCLERARSSNLIRPALESEVQMDPEDTNKNDYVQHHNINGPRKYDIILRYEDDSESTNLWLKGYDLQTETSLPLELVLQDIQESYPQECVIRTYESFGDEIFTVKLNLSDSSSFIKDIYAREGVQPDFKNYFSTWLSALFPTIKCLGN